MLPEYPHEDFATNVLRCQRYFQKNIPIDTGVANGVAVPWYSGLSTAATNIRVSVTFANRLRAAPSAVNLYKGSNSPTNNAPGVLVGAGWVVMSAVSGVFNDEGCFILSGTAVGTVNAGAYAVEVCYGAEADF
jgi:hypothetical protein